jgi:hypothetical protein
MEATLSNFAGLGAVKKTAKKPAAKKKATKRQPVKKPVTASGSDFFSQSAALRKQQDAAEAALKARGGLLTNVAGGDALTNFLKKSTPEKRAAAKKTTGPAPQSKADSYAALRNDVIRFEIAVASTDHYYSASDTARLASKLAANGFQVLGKLDDSELGTIWGGTIRGQARINSDGYANIQDAADLIAGVAQSLGFRKATAHAEFVSRARGGTTSDTNTIAPPDPGSDPFSLGAYRTPVYVAAAVAAGLAIKSLFFD